MKNMKKLSGYVSPMLTTVKIELEQVIAASREITGDDNSVTETWVDENVDAGEIELFQ